ncbi:MAG TPA: DUF5060 domain-containing protein [Abditibacteriaceae bacterium]|jgi:hypothetical protein
MKNIRKVQAACWLLAVVLVSVSWLSTRAAHGAAIAGSYPRIEASFTLPNVTTDPFDYEQTDVRVQVRRGRGEVVSVPAFFDGGTTWRIRHTPSAAGRYTALAVTLNGKPVQATTQPREWQVSGAPQAGYVRIDRRDARRFAFDSGAPYYPLGHNQAWQTGGLPDVPEMFTKMGASGENWSRVWMNHWDSKNLDWLPSGKPGPFGQLSLDVARRWDSIVQSAEKNGIYFQMVFQHHGQYSTQVNPNWNENPYNARNGGFLQTPNEFFTNAQARALTRRKLRYAVARWGYSPAIMAWELFNEVQFTDAARGGQWDAVAAWHNEMALFLRQQDVYDHLVTTSSIGAVPAPVWVSMDYYQEHTYPADVITALNRGNTHTDMPMNKPYFIGEFGPSGVNDPTGAAVHAGLWAGMMSGDAGAPQFWTWDNVERNNLYHHFRAASGFLTASRLAHRPALKKATLPVATAAVGSLSFGPGGDWGQVRQSDFVVESGGPPNGIGSLSRFLQGNANRALSPNPWIFHVRYPQAGQFILDIAQISTGGAHVTVRVDGGPVLERDFPATGQQYRPQGDTGRIAVDVPAGAHTITLNNSGGDWADVQRITLTNYSPVLGAYGLSGSDFTAAWIYHRANVVAGAADQSPPVSGRVSLPGLSPGRYRVTWWDTQEGKPLQSTLVTLAGSGQALSLDTPAVSRDVALYVTRMG